MSIAAEVSWRELYRSSATWCCLQGTCSRIQRHSFTLLVEAALTSACGTGWESMTLLFRGLAMRPACLTTTTGAVDRTLRVSPQMGSDQVQPLLGLVEPGQPEWKPGA